MGFLCGGVTMEAMTTDDLEETGRCLEGLLKPDRRDEPARLAVQVWRSRKADD